MAQNADKHSHAAIRADINKYLLEQTERFAGKTSFKIGGIDKRSRFTLCNQSLEIFETVNGLKPGRNVVGVRCDDVKPWKIFVPVNIQLLQNIVVARVPISRGQAISHNDIELKELDSSRYHRGFFTQAADLKGFISKRNIKQGTVITPSSLKKEKLVKRNSQVKIVMKIGSLVVHSSGKALSDGSMGQRIKIKNKRSGKTITATVAGSGLVHVIH